MSIGQNIKFRRKELELTLEDVAERVSVSRQTLSRYETGVIGNIPSDKIELLAKALDTTPSYLMGWEPQQEKPAPSGDELDKELIEIWNTADRDERRDLLDMARMLKNRRK